MRSLIDYTFAYENNPKVKEYVDKYKTKHGTTVEVALKHRIVQDCIDEVLKDNV